MADVRPVDADNHYYEALDAFTRHVPAAMQPRCVEWCEMNGRRYHVVGGVVSHGYLPAFGQAVVRMGCSSQPAPPPPADQFVGRF